MSLNERRRLQVVAEYRVAHVRDDALHRLRVLPRRSALVSGTETEDTYDNAR